MVQDCFMVVENGLISRLDADGHAAFFSSLNLYREVWSKQHNLLNIRLLLFNSYSPRSHMQACLQDQSLSTMLFWRQESVQLSLWVRMVLLPTLEEEGSRREEGNHRWSMVSVHLH